MSSVMEIGFGNDVFGDMLLGEDVSMIGHDIWENESHVGVLKSAMSIEQLQQAHNSKLAASNATTGKCNMANVEPMNYSFLEADMHIQPLPDFGNVGQAFEQFDHLFDDIKELRNTPRPVLKHKVEYNSHTSMSPQSKIAVTPNITHSKGKHALCQVEGCGRRVRSKGYCKTHGGGRKCIIAGCRKSSQNGEFCIGHGGGKKCKEDGCAKAAQSHGLCKAHGGGARCKFSGCVKSSQGGGLCRAHGGGKRCQADGCPKGAQRGNFCATHGGFRSCQIEGCVRTDRGGGYCEVHRRDKLCRIKGCKKLSKNKGLCTTHIRKDHTTSEEMTMFMT